MPGHAELVAKRLEEIARRDAITTDLLDRILHEHEQDAQPASRNFPVSTRGNEERVIDLALQSWERFRRGDPLDSQDIIRLESIILRNGLRPAFDVQNGSYEKLPSVWRLLDDRRVDLEPIIASIGRLELTGHPSTTLSGTGFLCGMGLVMTNRHAAQNFVQGIGAGVNLTFVPGVLPSIDFIEEVGRDASLTVSITAPLLVLEEWDIALLRLDGLSTGLRPLPMVSSEPAAIHDAMAAIVGYPGFDPRDSVVSQLEIFRGVFDKKRLQPGMLRGVLEAESFGRSVRALGHDCSTVGGNSGSALVAAETAKVVGIHFGGRPAISNFAVPTWELAAHPLVRQAGVEFVS